jgi:hypothetical protein
MSENCALSLGSAAFVRLVETKAHRIIATLPTQLGHDIASTDRHMSVRKTATGDHLFDV